MKDGLNIDDTGNRWWFFNESLHREDGPAVEWADGSEAYFLNGRRHRKDGPAMNYKSGTKEWWLNGIMHRLEGPAVHRFDGYKEWYLNSKEYSEEEHPFNIFRKEYNLSEDYNQWSKDKQMLFKLIYGGK